jgi:DNA-binding NtrC family response regulator
VQCSLPIARATLERAIRASPTRTSTVPASAWIQFGNGAGSAPDQDVRCAAVYSVRRSRALEPNENDTAMTNDTYLLKETVFVEYRKVLVTVSAGPCRGESVELVDRTLRVGSHSDNDLVLNQRSVSRYHCSLVPVPGGVRIRDEGSTNGVWMGELRLFDAICVGPLEIKVGECRLAIQPLAETETRELATQDSFGELLGQSAAMRQLFVSLAQWARTDHTLLLVGETGTGKELAAAAVHRASARASGPFVVLDCSTLTPGLLGSQLFGHEKGAFTGAHETRKGVFERAHRGTLFLDELGELPLELQPWLLRALETPFIQRAGGERNVKVDVRVIAATNRELESAVNAGRFRQDLYERFSKQVRLPPLRDRLEDLPLLVKKFSDQCLPKVDHIPEDVWAMFQRHFWPGNVRELRNAVVRFAVEHDPGLHRADAKVQPFHDAMATAQELEPSTWEKARSDAVYAFTCDYLVKLMRYSEGSVSRGARVAELSEWGLRKLLKRHGIRPEAFRA